MQVHCATMKFVYAHILKYCRKELPDIGERLEIRGILSMVTALLESRRVEFLYLPESAA